MFAKIRGLHRNLSHQAGYRRGQAGRSYRCPWWANKLTYATAHLQGRKRAGPAAELFSAWTPWAVTIAICCVLIMAMSWQLSVYR
jgi:hypothetical protein